MSYYLANEKWIDKPGDPDGLLGQCATVSGLEQLTSAVDAKTYPVLAAFFADALTDKVTEVRDELEQLAVATKDKDVESTARGMRALADGQEFLVITDGFYDDAKGENPIAYEDGPGVGDDFCDIVDDPSWVPPGDDDLDEVKLAAAGGDLAKYSEDQERDDHGLWTSSGGGQATPNAPRVGRDPKQTGIENTFKMGARVAPAVKQAFASAVERMKGIDPELIKACGPVAVVAKKPSGWEHELTVVGLGCPGELWISADPKIAPDWRSSVVAHEFGHHIELQLTVGMARELGWNTEAFKAGRNMVSNEFENSVGNPKVPSEYARTNLHEWHAEAFRLFNGTPRAQERLKSTAPVTYAFWKAATTGGFKK